MNEEGSTDPYPEESDLALSQHEPHPELRVLNRRHLAVTETSLLLPPSPAALGL